MTLLRTETLPLLSSPSPTISPAWMILISGVLCQYAEFRETKLEQAPAKDRIDSLPTRLFGKTWHCLLDILPSCWKFCVFPLGLLQGM